MNWDQLILRAIVPFSFVAIWALTALFNKESSKGFPAKPQGPSPLGGPRHNETLLRWAPPASSASPSNPSRRVSIGEDDILIIQGDSMRTARASSGRPIQGVVRRSTKGRATPAPARKPEPAPSRPKLAGVSQNVNQSLAKPIELSPLTAIAPMATSTSAELANSPSAPSKTSAVVNLSNLRPLMTDPIRLREAFIVNELFRPPVALRGRRSHHA